VLPSITIALPSCFLNLPLFFCSSLLLFSCCTLISAIFPSSSLPFHSSFCLFCLPTWPYTYTAILSCIFSHLFGLGGLFSPACPLQFIFSLFLWGSPLGLCLSSPMYNSTRKSASSSYFIFYYHAFFSLGSSPPACWPLAFWIIHTIPALPTFLFLASMGPC